jgi:hypothetical protein
MIMQIIDLKRVRIFSLEKNDFIELAILFFGIPNQEVTLIKHFNLLCNLYGIKCGFLYSEILGPYSQHFMFLVTYEWAK